MIFAWVAMVLGVSSVFTDGPVQAALCVAALAAGALYVRSMRRRARGDAR